jgi:phage terminase small subunit
MTEDTNIEEIDNEPRSGIDHNSYTTENKSRRQLEKELNEAIFQAGATLSPFEKKFAEYYARSGQAGNAARQAGSTAEHPGRVGANTLKRPGVQDYLALLGKKSAMMASLDAGEIIELMRDVYTAAMEEKNFKEANIAARNLAEVSGLIGKPNAVQPKENTARKEDKKADRRSGLERLLDATKEAKNDPEPSRGSTQVA